MSNARRFPLDELTIRPGTYFNPQTEILIVVDDSPEVDHEIFNMDEFDGAEWVLISEDSPLDERKRDELVDHFQVTYQGSGELSAEELEEEEEEEDDELDVDELELDSE
jgi:hypothetical protein